MVFIFTLEMQLPSGINTIQTGCLACKLKRSEQHTKQQERAQRITEDINARGNMRNRIKLLKKKCLGKMNQESIEITDEHPLLRSDFMSVGAD